MVDPQKGDKIYSACTHSAGDAHGEAVMVIVADRLKKRRFGLTMACALN
jgi:hypothetical protein